MDIPGKRIYLGFNGAAGIHRRKHTTGIVLASFRYRASMGPPEFTGGNARNAASPAGR